MVVAEVAEEAEMMEVVHLLRRPLHMVEVVDTAVRKKEQSIHTFRSVLKPIRLIRNLIAL